MREYRRQKRASAIKKIRAKFGYGCQYEVLLFCSNKNVYAQVVDLKSGNTLLGVSTLALRDGAKNCKNIKKAEELGKILADKCKEKKITKISFNRAEKIFHGVVKSVADSFYGNLN